MTMQGSAQSRLPAGAPASAGGQFTGEIAPRPSLVLMPSTPEQPYGTISFPSIALTEGADAETYVQRVFTLPVPDRVASNALFAHGVARQRRVQGLVEAEMAERLAEGGDLDAARKALWRLRPDAMEVDLRLEIYQPAEADAYARAHASLGPVELPRTAVVDIVRAAVAYRYGGMLPTAERERLIDMEVPIGAKRMTTRDACELYLTHDWIADALTDSDLRVAAALRAATEAFERSAER